MQSLVFFFCFKPHPVFALLRRTLIILLPHVLGTSFSALLFHRRLIAAADMTLGTTTVFRLSQTLAVQDYKVILTFNPDPILALFFGTYVKIFANIFSASRFGSVSVSRVWCKSR
jgi:hypothetical protein